LLVIPIALQALLINPIFTITVAFLNKLIESLVHPTGITNGELILLLFILVIAIISLLV
jgi:hypothetical protein